MAEKGFQAGKAIWISESVSKNTEQVLPFLTATTIIMDSEQYLTYWLNMSYFQATVFDWIVTSGTQF